MMFYLGFILALISGGIYADFRGGKAVLSTTVILTSIYYFVITYIGTDGKQLEVLVLKFAAGIFQVTSNQPVINICNCYF